MSENYYLISDNDVHMRSGVRCSDLIISANRCMIILNCP